nr:MAG TPA: hypothetical protein [Caudoviricetes sp.]
MVPPDRMRTRHTGPRRVMSRWTKDVMPPLEHGDTPRKMIDEYPRL